MNSTSVLFSRVNEEETDVYKNYRSLRLIAIVRNVFEMALDKTLLNEMEDEPQQRGFQSSSTIS